MAGLLVNSASDYLSTMQDITGLFVNSITQYGGVFANANGWTTCQQRIGEFVHDARIAGLFANSIMHYGGVLANPNGWTICQQRIGLF
eukprot:4580351-Karenia_brevis.AAC.1